MVVNNFIGIITSRNTSQSPLTAILGMLRNCFPSAQVLKARLTRDGLTSKLLSTVQRIFHFIGTSGEVHACMFVPHGLSYSH